VELEIHKTLGPDAFDFSSFLGVSPSTTGSSNSAQRTNVRRSEGGSTLNNGFFHNRNPRTNRFGGSQRFFLLYCRTSL